MNRAEKAFALHKAPHIAEAVAKNIRHVTAENVVERATLDSYYEGSQRPYRVVGAGHTMPQDLGNDWRCENSTLVVNSALRAWHARGGCINHVVCRESLDMSEQLRVLRHYWAGLILDIGTHPSHATVAEVRELRWLIPATTQFFGIAERLGIEPVYAGQSNVTASVAIAEVMGATEIHLVGCSRAFAADGRAYADGTGWESIRLDAVEEVKGADGEIDHYVGTIVGTEAKERIHAASGQRAPLKRERVIPVTAIDGSTRWSLETLEADREWLENFAARHPHITCVQHDPDVAMAGWGHAPAKVLHARDTDLRAEVLRQCDQVARMAACFEIGGKVWELDDWMQPTDLPNFAGVGDRIRVMEALRGHPLPVGIAGVRRAWAGAGERVRGWVSVTGQDAM